MCVVCGIWVYLILVFFFVFIKLISFNRIFKSNCTLKVLLYKKKLGFIWLSVFWCLCVFVFLWVWGVCLCLDDRKLHNPHIAADGWEKIKTIINVVNGDPNQNIIYKRVFDFQDLVLAATWWWLMMLFGFLFVLLYVSQSHCGS